MQQNEASVIDKVLFSDDITSSVEDIKTIVNKELLHLIALKYNWDNGFGMPRAIIDNKYCDLGTAISLFYLADGYSYLNSENSSSAPNNKEWEDFMEAIYNKIVDNAFLTSEIASEPTISKVQVFKLKKKHPNLPDALFAKREGITIGTK
jgi:hypothetical protein